MGQITSSIGLVSGLDTAGIIDQLMQIEGRSRDDLVAGIIATGHRHARSVTDEDDLARLVREQAREGDIVVCLGAGSISGWARGLEARLG